MATLQETVQAVLSELQKLGLNLQDTDIAQEKDDFALLLGFKSDGSFIRLSPSVLSAATKKYLSSSEYQALVDSGQVQEGVEYNIYEDE